MEELASLFLLLFVRIWFQFLKISEIFISSGKGWSLGLALLLACVGHISLSRRSPLVIEA